MSQSLLTQVLSSVNRSEMEVISKKLCVLLCQTVQEYREQPPIFLRNKFLIFIPCHKYFLLKGFYEIFIIDNHVTCLLACTFPNTVGFNR